MPQLPTELIGHIIKLSVPDCTFATFAERAAILRLCCLVSRTWCSIARPLLFSSVVFRRQAGIEKFLSCTAHLEPEHLPRVKELRVQGWWSLDGRKTSITSTLTALFRRFPNFSYFNLDGAYQICLDIPLLLHLQQCRTLVLNKVYLDTTLYISLHFPNLRKLSLRYVGQRSGNMLLFSPSTVPNLPYMALETDDDPSCPAVVCWSLLAHVKVLKLSPEPWNQLMENSTFLPSAHIVVIEQHTTGFSKWVALSAPHLITHLILFYTPMVSPSGVPADTLWENIDLLKRKITPLTSLRAIFFSQMPVCSLYNVTGESKSFE